MEHKVFRVKVVNEAGQFEWLRMVTTVVVGAEPLNAPAPVFDGLTYFEGDGGRWTLLEDQTFVDPYGNGGWRPTFD